MCANNPRFAVFGNFFEGSESGRKKNRLFHVGFVTFELLVMSGRKVGMFVFTTVRNVSCSSEHLAYSRNTRFFSPVVDGPNL